MRIAGIYSFNRGKEVIKKLHQAELEEVLQVIDSVDAENCKTKVSKEKTMRDKVLYRPPCLNEAFKKQFEAEFVWDLDHRGVSDIDIPVLIIGIDTDGVKPKDLKIAEARQPYLFFDD